MQRCLPERHLVIISCYWSDSIFCDVNLADPGKARGFFENTTIFNWECHALPLPFKTSWTWNMCREVSGQKKQAITLKYFQRISPLADCFKELRCQYMYRSVPFSCKLFWGLSWPLDPGPLIISPGTTSALPSAHYHLCTTICANIHATIRALPSLHYHLRTTICALLSAHYHLRTTICALPYAVQPDDSWY